MRPEGRCIEVRGVVQGVGFRPAVFRLARTHALSGRVLNEAGGVIINVYGDGAAIDRFASELRDAPPPASRIDDFISTSLPFLAVEEFTIEASTASEERRISIPPDLATCEDCLRDIADPANRRYRYPFTNCTNCGPRYSIILDLPYDRASTTMRDFTMCAACRAEYESPLDRRFHAEPNACPACGPRLLARDPTGTILQDVREPIAFAARSLRAQLTVAVKGIGGFHLACDATSEIAVQRLRRRKHREAKPFAVMVPDLASAERLAVFSDEERALLQSVERPIVLVTKRKDAPIAPGVAPGTDLIGLFLPYSPLHHLLLADAARPLVMTSGNRSDEPMVRDQKTAIARLGSIADIFLTHDREIERRVDDSVARVITGKTVLFRRARGFVPRGVPVVRPFAEPILACGAHLKNTFCLASGNEAFLGPHVGDLEDLETLTDYEAAIEQSKRLLRIEPRVIAHDLHPGYHSTRYALAQRDALHIGVQHHHAHVASVMAEHRLDETVLGLAWDGTGFGTDGTSWGGELLLTSLRDFERLATFRPLRLAGGDLAVRQVWRIALAALEDCGEEGFLPDSIESSELEVVKRMLATKLNAPLSHGVGRWFDAFGAIFLQHHVARFEGEAALAWNAVADRAERGFYPFVIDDGAVQQVDMRVVLCAAIADKRAGRGPDTISARFHNTLARIACELIALRDLDGVPVVLTGGCFQNTLLTEEIVRLLGRSRSLYFNERIPPGDGGIALGQAVVADARLRLTDHEGGS